MFVRFPKALDAFSLTISKDDKNNAESSIVPRAEDVYYVLAELEKKLGIDNSIDGGSIDYRTHVLEALTSILSALISPVPGSLIFIGDGGKLAQDSSALFFDTLNKRLGILVPTPIYTLDVGGDVRVASRFRFGTANADGGTFAVIGLDAGALRDFEIFDYFTPRVMSRIYGATRNQIVYGSLGINVDPPVARLHAVEATMGSEVERLESTAASGTNPTKRVFQAKVETTNNTITTLWTSYTIPNNSMVNVIVRINGFRYNGSDRMSAVICASFDCASSVVAQMGATTTVHSVKITATNWVVTFFTSGQTMGVRVTGDTGHSIWWTGYIEVTTGANT